MDDVAKIRFRKMERNPDFFIKLIDRIHLGECIISRRIKKGEFNVIRGFLVKKKTYNKPDLKSRKLELGVFGDYGNGAGSGHDTGNTTPTKASTVEVVENLGLRME